MLEKNIWYLSSIDFHFQIIDTPHLQALKFHLSEGKVILILQRALSLENLSAIWETLCSSRPALFEESLDTLSVHEFRSSMRNSMAPETSLRKM